ncbi:MAG: NarK family nitrate/nitrite MFS transporter [Burkholderiales bacterium]|nr:NarK family nitrate/nitrite MFS transporter [Burkholderiales bacterium]
MSNQTLTRWNPEDAAFWESQGARIANRNLWISIPSLMLAFAVWMVWSVVVVNLPHVGFRFSTEELFWLAALPALCGASLRIVYSFMVPIFGGRRWTVISTASLAVPALGMGLAVQDPATPYSSFVAMALLCGLGGGHFSSSMVNINYFFPSAQKGTALGLNAGLGNLGVSLAQFVVPAVITAGIFGALGGEAQAWSREGETRQVWLQNAGFVWLPFIAFFTVAAWLGMDDLDTAKASVAEQARGYTRRHSWILAWLHLGTFGSFIGYSAALPLLIQSQFPHANALSYAWLGPLLGALIRPFGGWLADKLGGARVTFWNFAAMAAGVLGVFAFLPQAGQGGNFYGFLAVFMALFIAAGIGNGSTFRMIPIVLIGERLREAAGGGRAAEEQALREAHTESAGALGLASALGAVGGFVIPMSSGASITLTGGVNGALAMFIVFYATCIALTWWYYSRRGAAAPC